MKLLAVGLLLLGMSLAEPAFGAEQGKYPAPRFPSYVKPPKSIEDIMPFARAAVRQTGGRGQYGHVVLKIEPQEPGKGFEFVDAIKGGTVPREYIPAVEKGVRGTLNTGVLAGYPVVDVKVTLFFGSYHDVDSNEMSFKMAGIMAFRNVTPKARPVLLEPWRRNSQLAVPKSWP